MLQCQPVRLAYPKIHFRIIAAVNPLSQLYINGKFQEHISVSIHQCQRASLLNSLLISYKNDEWCQFGVHICSPVLISFYCVCVASSTSLFFSFYFLWSFLLAKVLRQLANTYNKAVKLFLQSFS